MLDIHHNDGPTSKVRFSHNILPRYIDQHNPSTKKKPFTTFNAQPFSHTLDLVLPKEIYELVRGRLESDDGAARGVYAKVYMKLGEVLEGDFFSGYIKQGNIMMRSEGRPLVDNMFSLYEGVLRLELDRPTYERCGLQGTPIEDGGKKHQKNRWVVEFDLRASNMVHGKKGFSRLEWACKNVLNHSLTWLFYNFNPSAEESLRAGTDPISIHQPKILAIGPMITRFPHTLVPKLTTSDFSFLYDPEDALALQEYLALLSLGSPRVAASDSVDPHLSRYEVPSFNGVAEITTKDIVRVRWRGFIPPQFVRMLFLAVRDELLKSERVADHNAEAANTAEAGGGRWLSWSATGFGGNQGWTMMHWAAKEALVWEYAS